MPSPFPGMDPYLENPSLFPDVHHEFISVMREFLAVQLRPKYHVRVEERVYISDDDDPGRTAIIPDLRIADLPQPVGAAARSSLQISGEVSEPLEVVTLLDDEIHEARLEIIDVAGRQVVTIIEVISPSNKITGSRGRASYQQKRLEIMNSPSNWMEIDLLRKGERFVSRTAAPACDYLVHVSRT